MESSTQVTRVADTRCETGEGPIWHPDEGVLFWCDIPSGRLLRYDPKRDRHECVLDGDDALSGVTIQEDGALLLFRAGGRVERFDGGSPSTVATVGDAAGTRFNDVVADPKGRVFAGTMPTGNRLGRLYRFDTDGSIEHVEGAYDIPNGMGYTTARDAMYVTESNAKTVYRFDYDPETGALTRRRTFLDVRGEAGIPDGMAVDADGDVWSARWNGSAVVRYDASATERERVRFPAAKVSSVAFGGPDYRDVYVTTAGGDDRASEGDGAGALFRFPAPSGVRGTAPFRSAFPTD
ncbi:D-xylonolactonase [Halarchaeum solikamskense]|uniref:SMP-30/gluconolactonase/LRE family protein n=1 Tax=Halarchaeum nitratireducens TaxID=489913 RepID=UPI001B3ACB2E|nr:SMP-30/gluconolactonase/LRE family protein [Halarchaeum solikamskense]MBP2252348.1 D-xylonolactonase [Halarchaeum solikamskense]